MSIQIPRALVLDSDFTEYTACIRALKVRGWFVEEAPSFDRALALLIASPFNFVILDLQPPDADGMDAWAFIRKLHPDIFGIITTKSPSLRTSINPFVPGILAFMLKPPEAHIVAHLATIALEFQTMALDNRRLQSNLVGLSQLTSSLAWSPNHEHAVKLALAHLPGILASDIAFITLLDRDREPPEWSQWMFAGSSQGAHLLRARTLFFQQWLERFRENTEHVPTSLTLNAPNFEAGLTRALLRSVHLTPILVGDGLVGALVVANHAESPNRLSFMQTQLCNIVGQILGIIFQSQSATILPLLDPEDTMQE